MLSSKRIQQRLNVFKLLEMRSRLGTLRVNSDPEVIESNGDDGNEADRKKKLTQKTVETVSVF